MKLSLTDLVRRWIVAPSHFVALFAAGIWLLCLSWVRPLTLPDEGRYGGVAWEMLSGGAHATPLLDGMPFFHKPPLYYWLAEASYGTFGAQVWAARLPSWLAAWAVATGVYFFMLRWRGKTAAMVALLALATQPFFLGGAQFANLDMLVAGLIGLTTLCGGATVLSAYAGKPYRALSLATAILAGLGVLAKGLIGVVLPGAILVLWIVLRRKWRGLAALLWPAAIVAFLAVALPWYWLMQVRYPGFFNYFFVYQQFERFSATGFNNVQPFWFYVPVIAAMTLPWVLWLGGAMRKSFWQQESSVDTAADVRWLAASWAGVVLVFFSIPSSKLVGYVLPLLPALAVIIAEVIVAGLHRGKAERDNTTRKLTLSLVVGVLVCILGTGVAAIKTKPNSNAVGVAARAEVRPEDTVIALHVYPYDLPMTLRLKTSMWIVDDWTHPDVALRDNWRKELFDAGQFDKPSMQRNLISEKELTNRVCVSAPGTVYWIWGEPAKDSTRYAILKGQAPRYADGKKAMWRIVVDADTKRRLCGGQD
ncbi:glycosyltransferase family 39 protein [Bordetella sp. N]|uniref:ArnT family glycosyltransferase n=1 Tax=Bordetella sp. N TaxID=1746199 RepID=UPI00071023FC|nr:glycosyltransferase family 39 protein [Bordetella sp. N]ALM82356.1 dolichyl-phosphate-mannose-protein mannosyltransferase [Bordetella sp. N]